MKERIDILLVERRLAESRVKAQWLIRKGYVSVNKKTITKPGKRVDNTLEIHLKKEFPYVGRGGLKLEAALKNFSISVENKVCVDLGASVGGFTDCLLKHGAKKVYAIDKATTLLHPSLQCEKMKGKVIPKLGIDARNLIKLKENVDICTIDITFASLKEILPNVKYFLKDDGDIIALVKPLFETEYQDESKFRIINNHEHLNKILKNLIQWSLTNQFYPYQIINSPNLGKDGSIEFFIHFKLEKPNLNLDYNKNIDELLKEKN